MPPKDLGTKHTCFKCSTKFYDMKKSAPICPKCGADQRESPALKAPPAERRARSAPRPVEPVDEVEAVEELDEDVEADDDEVAAEDDDDDV